MKDAATEAVLGAGAEPRGVLAVAAAAAVVGAVAESA